MNKAAKARIKNTIVVKIYFGPKAGNGLKPDNVPSAAKELHYHRINKNVQKPCREKRPRISLKTVINASWLILIC